MKAPPAGASFDPVPGGYRFTLRYDPPANATRCGTVILAPAFAEEMNRCRRMTAVCSRHLALNGWRVLVRDPLGCGDSSGDFGDATWQAWVDDLERLLSEIPRSEALWLWGVRAGSLLLPALLVRRPDANLLLWQPAFSGTSTLHQFLRIKVAAAALAGKERIDAKHLRRELSSGKSVEVSGYVIRPELAADLERARLALPDEFAGRVVWLEVGPEPPTLSPAGEQVRSEWMARSVVVDTEAVSGDAFWQIQEATECPALIQATLKYLSGRNVQVAHAICRVHRAERRPDGTPRRNGA